MRAKLIIFSIMTACTLGSCESILEIDPISEITMANYWKSESDVKGYLNGLYSDYRGMTSTTLYGEDRGDAMVSGVIGGISRSHQHELNEEYGLDWRTFYENIHHCNMIIKYAPGIDFALENEKKRILAQAYTFRAKAYLTLTQMWGDVPIVLNPTESYDKESRPARSAASEVMKQILSDVQTAVDLFPETNIPDKNRISRPAALCLKAEALAWKYTVQKSNDKNDLTDAISALEEVEKCGVSMMDKYVDIFDVANKKNSEIIFSIYLKKDEYNNMYMSTLSMSAAAGLLTNDIVNKEDIPYTNSTIARHVYAPSPRLISLFSDKDNRASSAYINAVNSKGAVVFTSQNKFRGTAYTDDRYYDNDIVVYRLGEVKLLKAELLCYLGGDNVQKAIDAMFSTRNRAGIGVYTGSTDQKVVQKEILDERGRELCFELKRWPDLMRAHHAGTIDIYSYIPNLIGKSTPLYFPILRKMIDLNPNLEQTDGY